MVVQDSKMESISIDVNFFPHKQFWLPESVSFFESDKTIHQFILCNRIISVWNLLQVGMFFV